MSSGRAPFGNITAPLPFAIGQEKPLQTGPYLGGFVYVLLVAVTAGNTVAVAPGFIPRTVQNWGCPAGAYPSRVQRSAPGNNWTQKNAVVTFENNAAAGTILFFF
jgi:hypothetical protein